VTGFANTVGNWVRLLVGLVTLVSASAAVVVAFADTRYAQTGNVQQQFIESRLDQIELEIRRLELKMQFNKADQVDQAMYQELLRKREFLLKKVATD